MSPSPRDGRAHLLRSPALHMALLGACVFALLSLGGGTEPGLGDGDPMVVVPQHRVDLVVQGFVEDNGRLPSLDERRAMVDALIDDEVLYQYALALGLFEHPAVQTRLAKIAEFVEANPHEGPQVTEAARAEAAMELGLHHGDVVVRRIMVDSARRLIRSVVLLQEPTNAQIEAHLAANREAFLRPGKTRISHVSVNEFKWDDPEARARELLAEIRSRNLDLDAALALGDDGLVPARLPALTDGALETKLGWQMARAVAELPVAAWSGPVPSRYGQHLVWVHERTEAELPPLDEIRAEVSSQVRHELADQWLAGRLVELREEMGVEAPDPADSALGPADAPGPVAALESGSPS